MNDWMGFAGNGEFIIHNCQLKIVFGAVAQLGRAVRSQRTGRRFDPALLHKTGCARRGASGAL